MKRLLLGAAAALALAAPASAAAAPPEPTPGATGNAPRGTLRGWADTHVHVTADERAGGRVISGRPFDPRGVAFALGDDARDHGADGSLDVTGNLLRTGNPFGAHDTHGWPTFTGWPTYDTNTHQQTYWVWLERAWKAGLRLIVAQTVEDQELCAIEPRRSHSCDETKAIRLQVRELHAMERYIDRQAGGPGRGFFRLVRGPREAARVIKAGKLAVVIGVESSNPFGCRLRDGAPRCSRAQVDRGLARFRRWGVRSMFLAHWVDNAFGGAALEGGTKGVFINLMQRLETGRYFRTGACPAAGQGEELTTLAPALIKVFSGIFPHTGALLGAPMPDYPKGRRCNAEGLTPRGRYLVKRMIAEHLLVEADHLSIPARDAILDIATRAHYAGVISSHNGTGGAWTPAELEQLYALGGLASQTAAQAPQLARKIVSQRRYHPFGVALGTDTGGFSTLPAPRGGHHLRYPFTLDGVRFTRQKTGERTFDLNTDGVAHYGLFADLIADMRDEPHGREATRLLSRSAEAYLRMWRAAGARG